MRLKLSPHAFIRFWDLHAWTGVCAGLFLYIMFLAGGITLFREQLETWEEPLAQREAAAPGELQRTLDRVLTARGETGGDLWFYPPKGSLGEARLGAFEGEVWGMVWLDSRTNRLVPERERLARFIYNLHFLWHDVTGDWLYHLGGLLAVAMVLALVTGLLIHLKDIARQFHQFRPGRSRRVLWSDMHKVLGVMGLPFQLMYAYTGAFIVLAPLLLRTFTGPVFGGDEARAAELAWGISDGAAGQPGGPARALPLDELESLAFRARPDLEPEDIHLVRYGQDDGVVEIGGTGAGTPRPRVVVRLRARDGELLGDPRQEGVAASTRKWLQGLHFAHFGGLPLRMLFFFLALAGCATILTGNWIWLVRRVKSRGNEVLARLTAGTGAGAWVALAALFLASRVLPLEWTARGTVEELTFLGVLAACIVWALRARDPAAIWWRQLGLAAGLLLPVPVLASRWSSSGLLGPGPRLAPVVAVDVGILLAAAMLSASAVLLRRAWLKRSMSGERRAEGTASTEGGGLTPARHETVLAHARGTDA